MMLDELCEGRWETGLAELLTLLSGTQGELLALLDEKRQMLIDADQAGLAAIVPREEQLIAKLQACQDQRRALLQQAADEGLPCESLQALTAHLPSASHPLRQNVKQARAQARLLQHQSLTNWVLVQRTLLHLAQMLEIIATGGRPETTYGAGEARSSGSLLDSAA